MPEQAQRPATDDQLRMAADRAVARWIDETERALRDRWVSRPADVPPLASIAAEDRRRWWADRLRDQAHERLTLWRDTARRAHREITDQTFAQLRTLDPRPGERDVERPDADLQRRLTDLLTATAAGAPPAEQARAVDAALADLVAPASALEDLRAAKSAELTLETQGLAALIAHVREIEAGAPASNEPSGLKRMVLEQHLAARNALRLQELDVRRAAELSDRDLQRALDTPLLERFGVVVTPFNTARTGAAAALAQLPGIVSALEAAAAAFDARFGDADTLARAHRQVAFYGPAAVRALCLLAPEVVAKALAKVDRIHGAEFHREWPANTPQDALVAAFKRAALYTKGGGYEHEDRINSAS